MVAGRRFQPAVQGRRAGLRRGRGQILRLFALGPSGLIARFFRGHVRNCSICCTTTFCCSTTFSSRSRFRAPRSEEHTSELQSRLHLVCRLLLEKKKKTTHTSPVQKKKKKNTNI